MPGGGGEEGKEGWRKRDALKSLARGRKHAAGAAAIAKEAAADDNF